MDQRFKALAVSAARAASGKKGEEIALLNVSRVSPITDFILIVTATSRPHLETLEREVEKAGDEAGTPCLHRAKPKSESWRVLDFGGLLVHLMTAQSRAFYALDKLYHEAPKVPWEPRARKAHA